VPHLLTALPMRGDSCAKRNARNFVNIHTVSFVSYFKNRITDSLSFCDSPFLLKIEIMSLYISECSSCRLIAVQLQ
jgi:hypothetical protein